MKQVKKILAALIVMTLVASSFAVGAATKSPEKKKLDPTKTTVAAVSAEVVYTGAEQEVDVVVKYEGETLKEGVDYTVVKPKVKDVGTYELEAKVTGIGHYEGELTAKVTVTVRPGETTTAQEPTTIAPETTKAPVTTVAPVVTTTKATAKPKAPGKVKIKKAYKKKSAKKLTVKIKKIKGVKGYQVRVFKNKKKAKKNKKAIVKKYVKKNKAKLVIKNKKLKKKKKLYVRVRAYKVFNGKKIFGKWSKVKKVKIKK